MIAKEIQWVGPKGVWVKANCDGAASGYPGWSGSGIIFRDYEGLLGVLVKGLGIGRNYEAEVEAMVLAAEKAGEMGWDHLWLESDSLSAVQEFNREVIPWVFKARWAKAKRKLVNIKISHVHREASFGADAAAKYGASMTEGEVRWSSVKPDFIGELEVPNKGYFRFPK
ncbi:hypothetical protein ACHQM5_024728 [Ranunculus cassubicifolius]